MRRRRLTSQTAGGSEINISPLIDIVFILLIFFIVTTVFIEEAGVTVEKPRAVSAAELERESIIIAITRDRNVVYGGREIGLGGVQPVVRRLLQNEQRPIIIQADRSVPTEVLVQVIDEAQLAGAGQISIATER